MNPRPSGPRPAPGTADEQGLLERAWAVRYSDPALLRRLLDRLPASAPRQVVETFLAWRAQELDEVLTRSRQLTDDDTLPQHWRARVLDVHASTLAELGLFREALDLRRLVGVHALAGGERVLQITNVHDTGLLLENIDPPRALDHIVRAVRAARAAEGLTDDERTQLAGFVGLAVVNAWGLRAHHDLVVPDDLPTVAEARDATLTAWPEIAAVLTALLVEEALDEGRVDEARLLGAQLPDPTAMRDVVDAVLVARALSRLLALQGRRGEAVALLERELERLPLRNSYEPLERLVEIHEAAGDLAAALAASRRLVDALVRVHEAEAGTALRALEVHYRTEQAQAAAAAAREQARLAAERAAHATRTIGSLREQAERDPLTGLRNRRYLVRAAPSMLERPGASLAVIDIDCFKSVNDRLGHGAGDAVLARVADALRGACRADDVVARLAGDEFVVVRPAGTEDDLAADLAPVASPRLVPVSHVQVVEVGLSIGVASGDGRGWDDAFARADRAMYRAKRAGGGAVHVPSARPADPAPR